MNSRTPSNILVFIGRALIMFVLKTVGIIIAWLLQLLGIICTTIGDRLVHTITNKR